VEQCFGLISSARHMLEVGMTENATSLLGVAVLSLTELIEELRQVELPRTGAPSAAFEIAEPSNSASLTSASRVPSYP
jgi:hypothetical protein